MVVDHWQTLQAMTADLGRGGDAPALVALAEEGPEATSYERLAGEIDGLARGLAAAGVGRGSAVAVVAGTGVCWYRAALAVLRAGAILVPVDTQLDDTGLQHVLADSGCSLIFTTADHLSRVESLGPDCRRVLLDAGDRDGASWRSLLLEAGREPEPARVADVAALFYTSGTTGRPKGVPLTNANLTFQLRAVSRTGLVSAGDRLLQPLPLHHVYPFVMGVLAPLALGAAVVLPQSLTGPQIVRALKAGRVTTVVGVPRLYRALCAGIDERLRSAGPLKATAAGALLWLSGRLRRWFGLRVGRVLLGSLHRQLAPGLKLLASGGSALDPELAGRLESLGWEVTIGYGLTETAPLLTLNTPADHRSGSVGRPISGVELKLDPTAHPAAEEASTHGAADRGEILARGPNVFSGYHNLPDETRKVFDDEGWFRTGDLGRFDRAGYLFLLGRVSTMIVTEGGENIQPEDVESRYQDHPVIREIGILERDRRLAAVVVPELGQVRKDDDYDVEGAVRLAVAAVSRRLPSYQRVDRYVVSRESLPRTRLGKIRRHLLAELYDRLRQGLDARGRGVGPMALAEMSAEDRSLVELPAARRVWDHLVRRYADHRLTPDTSPRLDLGIDSLGWLNLTLEIGERTGVELSEEAIGRIETVRDLLHAVAEQGRSNGAAMRKRPLEHPEEVLSDRQKQWLEPLGPARSLLARALFALTWLVFRGAFRLRVVGAEHLPDRGPYVVTPNHLSYLDPFAVSVALGFRRLESTHWGGWTGVILKNPVNRMVVRLGQVVPIDPEHAVVSSLALGAAVLGRGRNLAWFPEGRRSQSGQLQPFRPGVALLIDHFRVPAVPVRVSGTYENLPPGRFLRGFHRVTVTFGAPVQAEELAAEGAGDDRPARIADALRRRVARLGPGER